MSTTPPGVEPSLEIPADNSGLNDEISDVVERHGRGRDADSLLEALNEVVAGGRDDEEWSRQPSRGELQRALRELLEACPEGGDREEVLAAMERLADDLRGGSLEPTVNWEEGRQDGRLRITFHSGFALKWAIPELTDMRGFFVECDVRPSVTRNLEVCIDSHRTRDSVVLKGRVLRTAPGGITVELYDADEEAVGQLHALAEQMMRTA